MVRCPKWITMNVPDRVPCTAGSACSSGTCSTSQDGRKEARSDGVGRGVRRRTAPPSGARPWRPRPAGSRGAGGGGFRWPARGGGGPGGSREPRGRRGGPAGDRGGGGGGGGGT